MATVHGALTVPSTKFHTVYVLNIYQIPHHDKSENVLAGAFMHIKLVVIWPYFLGTQLREPEPTLHTCSYTLSIFAFPYLILHLMLNTLSVLTYWLRDSIYECIQIHLVVSEAPDSAKC